MAATESTAGGGPVVGSSTSEDRAAAGVVGVGTIGAGVARALLRAGFPTVVHDPRPEATQPFADQATVAPDPAAVFRSTAVVVVAVVDDAQVRAVLLGPGGGLAVAAPGTVVVVVSTVSMGCLAEVAATAAAAGVDLVDCGVSGGPQAAARGDLVCMVGGDADAVARARPVLDAFGPVVVHMGGPGTGMAAKLARNVIQYGSWLAALEGQQLAEAAGVSLPQLAEVVRAADARAGGPTALMFRTTAAPFSDADDAGLVAAMRSGAALAHKDLRAALALAAELGVVLPGAALTEVRGDDVFYVGGGAP